MMKVCTILLVAALAHGGMAKNLKGQGALVAGERVPQVLGHATVECWDGTKCSGTQEREPRRVPGSFATSVNDVKNPYLCCHSMTASNGEIINGTVALKEEHKTVCVNENMVLPGGASCNSFSSKHLCMPKSIKRDRTADFAGTIVKVSKWPKWVEKDGRYIFDCSQKVFIDPP